MRGDFRRLLALESMEDRRLLASDFVLLKDVFVGPSSSDPRSLTIANGELYFTAQTGGSDFELWKSDGTGAGTVLVKDIRAGVGASNPNSFVSANGMLFFAANDGTTGHELWKSDGTEGGTILVKDIRAGASHSYPRFLTNVDGTLYFVTDNGTGGEELWKSNGTEDGTVRVKGGFIRSPASAMRYLTNVNGVLYFAASDGVSGFELWKSDETENGTVRVKDIHAGISSSYPTELINANGTLYFFAADNTSGRELWKSDGSEIATVRVKDISAGSSFPRYLTNANGTLFFSAIDGSSGSELWKSDGSEGGTVRVKDIRMGPSHAGPSNLTDVAGTLFFLADDGINGSELWKTNGTEGGTELVKDIFPGPASSNAAYLTNINGMLYMRANDGVSGEEVWTSDGTIGGTVLASDIASPGGSLPSHFTYLNGSVIARATSGQFGRELWIQMGEAPPVQTVPQPQSALEDVNLSISGLSVFDPDGDLSTTQLTVAHGVLNVVLSPGATISAGANGTSTLTISGTETIINATLSSLTYSGSADFHGSDELTVLSTDGTSQTDLDTITIIVTDIDDPAAMGGETAGNGDEDGGSITGTLTATDLADGLTDGTIFSLASGGEPHHGFASIDPATGVWMYSAQADFHGSDSFNVAVTDDDGHSAFQEIFLTINSVNDNPVVHLEAAASVDYGSPFTQVGTFTDIDSSSWTATVDYGDGTSLQTLSLDADKSFFLDHLFAAGGQYTVTVVVADNDGGLHSGHATVVIVVPGDIGRDGSVDASDAGIMFSNWDGSGVGDINDDGIVDAADAGIMFSNWTGDNGPIRLPTRHTGHRASRTLPKRNVDSVMHDTMTWKLVD